MDVHEGFAGVTLPWLYEEIEKRARIANQNQHPFYLAARRIQANYRGHATRELIKLWHRSAIIIQKIYRGYIQRKRFYEMLKEVYLQRMADYYDRQATIIQALFRGYYSRMYIHDHYKLLRDQQNAAKELIICIAHKLHFLLRTEQIPGVYSLRNSHCLSKVERLLDSLKFRNYNQTVRKIQCEKVEKIRNAIAEHHRRMNLPATFSIERKCNDRITAHYALDKFHSNTKSENEKILQTCKLYERTMNSSKTTSINIKCSKSQKTLKSVMSSPLVPKFKSLKSMDFLPLDEANICVQVVDSLTKHGIIKDQDNLSVCDVSIKKIENVEKFVDDVQSLCEVGGLTKI